jgi:outer membrane protein, heavy metal efflux system
MRLVLCAALALVFPRAAVAQSLPLTESDALSRLSDDSPRVRAIRAAIDIARADVTAAGRWPNPRLALNRESVSGITEYLTTVVQPLPISGQRDFQVRAASAMVAAAEARANDALRRARADLRLAFADLVTAQSRERELTGARDRLQELASVLARREAAGDAAGFDRLRAEREVADVEADLALAGSDRARAQAALVAFFGDPTAPSRIVAVGAPSTTSLPPLDGLVERAEAGRGELQALLREIDAAKLSVSAADRRSVPEPEIVAGMKSSNALGGDRGSIIAVQVPLPLFDHGGPERAAAEARSRQAEARAASLRQELRATIAGLHAALQSRRDAAARYRSTAVSSADQFTRIAQVSYDAGERSILELLDAFRTAANARMRLASLDGAVRQLEIELEYVSGWEIR